jgi:hypothetical protein
VYFVPWAAPDGALKKYLEQKDALHARQKPPENSNALIAKDLANVFLNDKQALVDAGELSPLTWSDDKRVAVELVSDVGKSRVVADLDAEDFAQLRNKMAKKWGPHRLKKSIRYVRNLFKHGYESGLIDRPMPFGLGWSKKAYASAFTFVQIGPDAGGSPPGRGGVPPIDAALPGRSGKFWSSGPSRAGP